MTAARSTRSPDRSARHGGRRRIELRPAWDDGTAPAMPVGVEPVVRLLGGEYLFLPSIGFLRGLALGTV